jgi:hypothetical protein
METVLTTVLNAQTTTVSMLMYLALKVLVKDFLTVETLAHLTFGIVAHSTVFAPTDIIADLINKETQFALMTQLNATHQSVSQLPIVTTTELHAMISLKLASKLIVTMFVLANKVFKSILQEELDVFQSTMED